MNTRMFRGGPVVLAMVVMVLPVLVSAGAVSPGVELQRAEWLLGHASLVDRALVGFSSDQDEIGGGVPDLVSRPKNFSGKKTALHIFSSLILPGSGEAMMGYKRGYLMMAADIFAWTRVAKYNNDGDKFQREFFDYADAHWNEARLVEAYNPESQDEVRRGLGLQYYVDVDPMTSPADFPGNLPLWVGKEQDSWEYYENLGKWDEFVFGWDDFVNPNDDVAIENAMYELTGQHGYTYTPTGTLADLKQPFTSIRRNIYREMRARSDAAYSKRDNWLYLNIGLRVFSVIQTAYLEGLLTGGHPKDLEVSGHRLSFLAQPHGWGRGTMAAAVSF